MAWYETYIERTPGIQGGYPVIRGTRTPVRSIVVLYYQTYPHDRAAVQRTLPHLTVPEIEAALAYYQDRPALIDEDIRRQQVALEQFLTAR